MLHVCYSKYADEEVVMENVTNQETTGLIAASKVIGTNLHRIPPGATALS
jgi:hypothetical protein